MLSCVTFYTKCPKAVKIPAVKGSQVSHTAALRVMQKDCIRTYSKPKVHTAEYTPYIERTVMNFLVHSLKSNSVS